jgi:hypothetical protein
MHSDPHIHKAFTCILGAVLLLLIVLARSLVEQSAKPERDRNDRRS